MSLKVIFCWSNISGYMAACWRTLHKSPEVEVSVIAWKAMTETSFTNQLMEGIPCHLLNLEEREDPHLIQQLVLEESPDIIILAGWLHSPYCKLTSIPQLQKKRFIMGMDTPWQGTWKQRMAPYVLRSYLQRMDRTIVTGERSWQYARNLGIPSSKIMQGLYGIDFKKWYPLFAQRSISTWPRKFLFVGRYVHAKAIDILVRAYKSYRNKVEDPWELICCGQGILSSHIQGQSGIIDLGFLQPSEMEHVWQSAGAFLLPSRFDPWPLAVLEAAASGLPIICTDVCGSAVEVVRNWYNGLTIPKEDSQALAHAMCKLHERHSELVHWGRRSQQLAAPYTAEVWTNRWIGLFNEL